MCDFFSQGYTWWRVATFEELCAVLIEHTNNSHTLNHGLFVIVLFIIRVIIFARSGLSTMKYFLNFYSFQKKKKKIVPFFCPVLARICLLDFTALNKLLSPSVDFTEISPQRHTPLP
jgi:hypothetical protein